MSITKIRVHAWLDLSDGNPKPFWGLQGRFGDGWAHLADGDEPLFFDDEKAARKYARQLRRELQIEGAALNTEPQP